VRQSPEQLTDHFVKDVSLGPLTTTCAIGEA